MGDPRKLRKKYNTPSHPWQKARMDEESDLKREYGLKNKTEIWKMRSILTTSANQAKRLMTLRGEQAEKEEEQLLSRLARLGLLSGGASLNDVLSLSVRDVLDRRLQTVVYKKGLARSVKQARQFITHNHILVEGKTLGVPSYIVPVSEEASITFVEASALQSPDHPERQEVTKDEAAPKKKKEKKDKKTEAPAEAAPAEEKPAEAPKEKAPEEKAGAPAEETTPEEKPAEVEA